MTETLENSRQFQIILDNLENGEKNLENARKSRQCQNAGKYIKCQKIRKMLENLDNARISRKC